ncbi:phenoloxidase-activating enzyme isoform X1 [Plutella xylostella]|uniref:phenoloxidase-activating enzyme isoform X1 n=1 Tax=Plutella xylostella TaxID=51655 RepID=UPI002032415C|nr:phenoloxidase-activating enzyme isoform X1 [Plutella xylostella]
MHKKATDVMIACRAMKKWMKNEKNEIDRLMLLDRLNEIQESTCNGQCVVIKQCPALNEIASKTPPLSQKDLETLRKAYCGYQGNIPKVCCPAKPAVDDNTCIDADGQFGKCVGVYSCPHMVKLLTETPIAPENYNYIQNSRCEGKDNYNVCCGPGRLATPSTPTDCAPTIAPPDRNSECCGREGSQGNRIFGGNATYVDQYPWLTLIEYRGRSDDRIKLLCGASLISSKYALTAAHCLVGPVQSIGTPINVRLGEYDKSNDGPDCVLTEGQGKDCTNGVTIIPIEKSIPHPMYDHRSSAKRHDIGLLRLKEFAPYDDFIRPICLPSSDITANPPDKLRLLTAGWGATDERHSDSAIKLHVALPYVTLQQCQSLYSMERGSLQLSQGQMCAGGEKGKDSCKGDSGGPLMYENRSERSLSGYFEIVGVVSFGPRICGQEKIPGVYTKVSEYLSWIRSNIKP